jgi:tagaturonate reductase
LLALPVKAVQFGTGAFLRGFIDYFLDEANRRGQFGGRVVAIGSTASGRDVSLNDQDGLYTLVVEGAGNDGPRQECRVLASVSRAISAQRDWTEVLAIARAPELELVFSNTTEVGITIDDGDRLDSGPPPSFPGKLARFLLERGRTFEYADHAGVVVIPCELIERNGERLRELVLTLAERWQLEPAFAAWLDRAVPFCNTLVDRIVPGRPSDEKRAALEITLGYRDELMIAAEPYRLFAIETDHHTRARLAFAHADDGIVLTDDVTPFRERKVRVLNGGHTLLASLGLAIGCRTVLEAVRHEHLGRYLRRVLHEEIVPTLAAPNGEAFAHDVLVRFANPYLRHALADITLQHTAKLRVRVVPSIVRYIERTGAVPTSLALGFAAYLFLQRAAASPDQAVRPPLGADTDGERVRDIWRGALDTDDVILAGTVRQICSDVTLWQTDLTHVPGFAEQVAADLSTMVRRGVSAALAAHIDVHQDTSRAFAPSLTSVR